MKLAVKSFIFLIVLSLVVSCLPTAFAELLTTAYNLPYYIEVDIANQITTVYNTSDNSIERQMICTTGLSNPTPCGTYYMPVDKYEQDRAEWYYFPEFNLYAKYATRILGGYLFHSILYTSTKSTEPTWGSTHSLGYKASHGCVRLRVDDAKWIAENCMAGTQVRIFDDAERDEELRSLLLLATYVKGSDVTYEEFLGGAVPLSKGANLSVVQEVQEKLNELGYNAGTPDGDFGTNTENAVITWQLDNGYEPDGVLTPSEKEVLMSAEPTASPEPTPTPDYTKIEGDKAVVTSQSLLNVRAEASAKSQWLAALEPGTEVKIIGYDGGWAKVVVNGTLGYVDASYVEVTEPREPTPTPTPSQTPAPTQEPEEEEIAGDPFAAPSEDSGTEAVALNNVSATVAELNSKLNVRSEPNTDATIVNQLMPGTELLIIDVADSWAHVQLEDGTTGYVMLKFLNYAGEELEEIIPEGEPATVVCGEEGLELRREPDANGGIITHLADGYKVYIQEEPEASPDWVKVYAGGFIGYLPKADLTSEEEEEAA